MPEDIAVLEGPGGIMVDMETVDNGQAETVERVLRLVGVTLDDLATEWEELARTVIPQPGALRTDSILQLVRDFASAPGKLLRPRMVHWGWVAAGGAGTGGGIDSVVRIGAALELLHCFALVHDDVMDASATRRGRPSVHALAAADHRAHSGLGEADRYGENIAILVGDLLHSEADLLVGGLPQPLRAAWRTMTIELMIGQGRDLVGAANGRRDLRHAVEVAHAKSGAYTVGRPLQLGALAAGGGPELAALLAEYGRHAGQAFALRDDILGVVGDPAHTGKPVGDDLVAGKPTVLLVLAEQRFDPQWRRRLHHIGREGVSRDEVDALCAELIRSGVIEEAEQMIEASVDAAARTLESPLVDDLAAAGLRRWASLMAWRNA